MNNRSDRFRTGPGFPPDPAVEGQTNRRESQMIEWDHCPACGSSDDDDVDIEANNGLSACHEEEIVSDCGPSCNHD